MNWKVRIAECECVEAEGCPREILTNLSPFEPLWVLATGELTRVLCDCRRVPGAAVWSRLHFNFIIGIRTAARMEESAREVEDS